MQDSHDLSRIIRFAEREEAWRPRLSAVVDEHFLPALETFELDFEDLADLLGEQAPWTLWGRAFEDFLSRHWGQHGENVVDVYLKRKGWSEKVLAKSYITGLRDAYVSLFEVSDVQPGKSMRLRDMLTGAEPVEVREKSASRSLKDWDRISARIVPVRDHYVMSGGLLTFSREASGFLFEGLRDVLHLPEQAELRLTPDQLRICAPVFSSAWLLTALPKVLAPETPELTNSDGEDLLFHEIRFPLAPGVLQGALTQRLDAAPELWPEEAKVWNWVAPKVLKGKKSSSKRGIALSSISEIGTILGTLELKGKALTLHVNSAGRAERGRALIMAATDDLLRPPLVSIQTTEQVIAE